MPQTVMKNPVRRKTDGRFIVYHPLKGTPFPNGEFQMSAADFQNLRVRRLFPSAADDGGVSGGKFGDLILVKPKNTAKK